MSGEEWKELPSIVGVAVPLFATDVLLLLSSSPKLPLSPPSALPTEIALAEVILVRLFPKFTGAEAADATRDEDARLLVVVVAIFPGGLVSSSLKSTGTLYSSAMFADQLLWLLWVVLYGWYGATPTTRTDSNSVEIERE